MMKKKKKNQNNLSNENIYDYNDKYYYIKSEYFFDDEDILPYEQKIYRGVNSNKEIKVRRYYRTDEVEYKNFLYNIIRECKNIPIFIKNGMSRIKNVIDEEINRRKKLSCLSKEIQNGIINFFKDENFFNNYDDDYYQIKLDIIYIDYINSLLNTSYYNIICDSLNKKEKAFISKFKIIDE